MFFDDLEAIMKNSYRNFHSKGLDYLCLKRSPELTIKAYFFDEIEQQDQIVAPHDHRYMFRTEVLAGSLVDSRYKVLETRNDYFSACNKQVYQQFSWHSPLLGGEGFSWRREIRLENLGGSRLYRGESLTSKPEHIHTISVVPETVLLLYQFEDSIPNHWATRTFVPGSNKEPPKTDGLYDQMPIDHVIKRMVQLRSMTTAS